MSVKLQISLEDIAKQLHDKDSKYLTVQEVLDELYGIGLTATSIASLLTGNVIPIPDLFKNFKPSKFLNNFMPTKYLNVTKEENAINRYEKLAINNLSIILVSFNQAVQENQTLLKNYIKQIQKEKKSDENLFLLEVVNETAIKHDTEIFKTKCQIPKRSNSSNHIEYINSLVSIFDILPTIRKKEGLIKKLKQDTLKYYNINLLEIMNEFPEVKMWINLDFQKQMIQANSSIKEELQKIRKYQSNQFNKQFGLEDMSKLLNENSNTQLHAIKDMLDEPTLKNITKHHNSIKNMVKEPLIRENDIKKLILPQRNEIYIPQSYKYFYYQKSSHKKNYLDDEKWCNIQHNNGEDIGKELFKALRDPYNINNPIILLGHPGAGKSMFSSQFAYKLIDNNEFIPFFIKLRDVDSSITDVDSHINQGIDNTIAGNKQIDWTEMAEKFSDKIPVIILDGFDELLRATQTQLNDYILKIQKLQKQAQDSNLNIRIILTSRLTIMQDVHIPENSLVIKLNSFDKPRKDLWIKKWNEVQSNGTKFTLPDRADIDELSKEPLLLFLLALYDFEGNALSKIADEGLSRSSLYDKLFEGFTTRQLRKDTKYNSSTTQEQLEIAELFRLRIGFFATMLFLHDKVHHLEKDFDEELNVFGLSTDKIKAKNILDGFFFIHKDKSTDGHEIENLSFEFLHKTFGEFLAADFMLRVAKFRAEDDEDISHLFEEKYFRQIFSFQWIYKQPKILEFLFEHTRTIVKDSFKDLLIKQIKKELKNILDENSHNTLPTTLHQLKTFEKLKHSAIYSQNLLLLWISLEKYEFKFNISKNTNNIQSWKVLTDLWKNYGGYGYVSYLRQYINVKIIDDEVILQKSKEHEARHKEYREYTEIANNNYETILSFYDEENILLSDILQVNYSKDKFFVSEISNLIISNIEKLYTQKEDYFNNKTFWNLWKNCSFYNKIKLSNFYLSRNINYTKIDTARFLYNSINKKTTAKFEGIAEKENFVNKESLSIDQSLVALEHFLKVEMNRTPAMTMLSSFLKEPQKGRGLSSNEQLKLLELSLEIDGGRREYSEKILRELFENSDRGRRLAPTEQLKLLELSLEIDGGRREYSEKILRELFENSDRGRRLAPTEQLKLLELSLEIDGGRREYSEKILRELFENSDRGRRLAPTEQLKLLELSLEIDGGRREYSEKILRELFENSDRGRRLAPTEQLKLLELSLEIDGGRREYSEKILRELFENSDRGRRLAPTEQLKLLELSLEIGNKSEAKNLLEILENTRKSKRTFSANYLNYLKDLFHSK